MNSTFTPWFDPPFKPKRPGVYQTVPVLGAGLCIRYQHWNGTHWGGYADSVRGADLNQLEASNYQNPQWRGFTKRQS